MRKLKLAILTGLTVGSLMSLSASSVLASSEEAPRAPQERQLIHDAFTLSVSPTGQQYFVNHLSDILAANGFSLDEGGFATWKYVASEPLRLDNLSMKFNDVKTTLGDLRDLIQKWLGGFQLKDPLFTVVVNGIHYSAKFSRLGLVVDSKATRRLDRKNDVIVDLEIAVPSLDVGADRILVTDANNAELGEMGMNDFDAKTADISTQPVNPRTGAHEPLKFKVPLEIEIDPEDGFTVTALAVKSNLSDIVMDWTYSRPLKLPQITITVNGTQMNVNYDQFEDEIIGNEQALAKSLQTYLQQFLAENGAKMINSMLENNQFTHIRENVNRIAPIGVPPGRDFADVRDLLFGMLPDSIALSDGELQAGVSAYVEDPSAARSVSLIRESRANGSPDLSGMDSSSYDLALSLNVAFVNRLMQLSYNRGYFKNMTSGDARFALNESPYLKTDPSLGSEHLARMHISMDYVYKPSGFIDRLKAAVAVHNPVRAGFDVITHVSSDSAGRIHFTMQSIDVNSASIESSSARWDFQSQVLAGVKAVLAQKNADARGKESELAPPMSIPRAILGIPVKVLDVRTDSTGHFNAFVRFGGKS